MAHVHPPHTHIQTPLAETAPDAGEEVEEREEVEGSEDGPPLVLSGVQVHCHQQLGEEHWLLEEGRQDEGLEVVAMLWILPARRGKGEREGGEGKEASVEQKGTLASDH